MTALAPFQNGEFALVVTEHEHDGFRVQAPGLARALGMRDAYRLLETIPEEEKGYTTASTPGGDQRIGYLTEAGFYRALGQRQAARVSDETMRGQVERFQTWVYRDVLPAIRRTGSYSTASALPDITTPAGVLVMAEQFATTARALVASQQEVADLAPRAEFADRMLNSDGDLSVADAGKALTRAGVKVGERRLFSALAGLRWVYRHQADGRWRVYQSAIEGGWMSVLPQSHYHPKTGVLVLDPPQPRVTPKGLQRLLIDHGVEQHIAIEAAAQLAVAR